jgi:hypothetical protein
VFEDRRHILTLDARGKVSLWDLVLCKSVASYPGKVRRRDECVIGLI